MANLAKHTKHRIWRSAILFTVLTSVGESATPGQSLSETTNIPAVTIVPAPASGSPSSGDLSLPSSQYIRWLDNSRLIVARQSPRESNRGGTLALTVIDQNARVLATRAISGSTVAPQFEVAGIGKGIVVNDGRAQLVDAALQYQSDVSLPANFETLGYDFSRMSTIFYTNDLDSGTLLANFVDTSSLKKLYSVSLNKKQWLGARVGDRAVVAPDVLKKCVVTLFFQDIPDELQIPGEGAKCYSALGFVDKTALLLLNHGKDLILVKPGFAPSKIPNILPIANDVRLLDTDDEGDCLIWSKNHNNVWEWIIRRKQSTLTLLNLQTRVVVLRAVGELQLNGALSPDGSRLAIEAGRISVSRP
jgi:hypothetical protein